MENSGIFTPSDGLKLLDIIKDQQKMIDNLAKSHNLLNDNLQAQITNLQRQIVILAKAGITTLAGVEEGLDELHKEAMKEGN